MTSIQTFHTAPQKAIHVNTTKPKTYETDETRLELENFVNEKLAKMGLLVVNKKPSLF